MKLLGRWMFNFAVAVSISIWLATAIAWPLSYWKNASLHWRRDLWAISLNINYGTFYLRRTIHPMLEAERLGGSFFTYPAQPGEPFLIHSTHEERFNFLGFSARSGTINTGENRPDASAIVLGLPAWFFALSSAWPIVPWIRCRRCAQRPADACELCGYDLRATPERCPECGKMPSLTKGSAT